MHILQNTIEAATGEPFEQLLSRLVFKPLGLLSARYIKEFSSRLPVIPVRKAEKPEGRYYYSLDGLACSSGVFMTAMDLNRHAQSWLSHGLPWSQLKNQAWKSHSVPEGGRGYGLMWWTLEDAGGYLMVGWGGQATAIVPRAGVVLTVLRNSYDHPNHGPSFKYADDKRHLVDLSSRLGSDSE